MSLGGRPLRFVGLVLAGWGCARIALLLPGAPEALREAPGPVRTLLGLPAAAPKPASVHHSPPALPPARLAAVAIPLSRAHLPDLRPAPAIATVEQADAPSAFTMAEQIILASALGPRRRLGAARPLGPGFDAAMAAGAAPASRWSGDGYLFLRGEPFDVGGGRALGPGGQIGGGQAFARITYRLDEAGRIAAMARLSRAVGARQTEAALGFTLAPIRGQPVRLTLERRVAIDRGGRDAFAAFVAGGIDDRHLGPLRLDGYAQAGIVGARRTDGFVDGALRLGREIGRVTLGAGAWGAAQPGAARLDTGPQAALRLPLGPAAATLALEGRIRVAGRARPGSGLALTLAAGF